MVDDIIKGLVKGVRLHTNNVNDGLTAKLFRTGVAGSYPEIAAQDCILHNALHSLIVRPNRNSSGSPEEKNLKVDQ